LEERTVVVAAVVTVWVKEPEVEPCHVKPEPP
jgi:hypothetical protein